MSASASAAARVMSGLAKVGAEVGAPPVEGRVETRGGVAACGDPISVGSGVGVSVGTLRVGKGDSRGGVAVGEGTQAGRTSKRRRESFAKCICCCNFNSL